MSLNFGKLSDGDYGEESLTSRFLIAHIFNKYSIVNMGEKKAIYDFCQRCMGIELKPDDVRRVTSTTEFQTNRCSVPGDNFAL